MEGQKLSFNILLLRLLRVDFSLSIVQKAFFRYFIKIFANIVVNISCFGKIDKKDDDVLQQKCPFLFLIIWKDLA